MKTTLASEITVGDFAPPTEQMHADVIAGLGKRPRELPTRYLYDERGSQLFEKICESDEYYLTRTELEIMSRHAGEMAAVIGPRALLIEPGSGSGRKTQILLEHLDRPAGYVPLDISADHLERSAAKINEQFPQLSIMPVCADFFGDFEFPDFPSGAARRVVYFPGSTIGNMLPPNAVKLLARMAGWCGAEAGLLIGVDLKKDRAVLEAAYDDAGGVSAEFALNYLVRLNRELHANFRLDKFDYAAPCNEAAGRIEMYLVSRCDQTVCIGDARFHFTAGERIRTEWSYKYTLDEFAALAAQAGLAVEKVWTDPHTMFSVQYLIQLGSGTNRR